MASKTYGAPPHLSMFLRGVHHIECLPSHAMSSTHRPSLLHLSISPLLSYWEAAHVPQDSAPSLWSPKHVQTCQQRMQEHSRQLQWLSAWVPCSSTARGCLLPGIF